MSYILVEDFRAGLDTRKTILTAPPGSLQRLENAHITRGGEIEKRKAFVPKYQLPPGTFGAAVAADRICVFGSVPQPDGIPEDVLYQHLQHPDGAAMTRLVDIEVFNGKIYALAEFDDGLVWHFYDGTLVTDWGAGIVRKDKTAVADVAEQLRTLIDADDGYTAARNGVAVTVTGEVGIAFDVATATANDRGTTGQEITHITEQLAVAEKDESLAQCSFRLVGGSTNAGVNRVVAVEINGVNALLAPVDWTTSASVTAANLALAVNNATTNPDYSASASDDTVTISAAKGSGAAPNGFVLAVEVSGVLVCTNGSFKIASGTQAAGTNRITSVKTAGVEILGAPVDWHGSHAETAAAVAAQINAFASSPEYVAYASGDIVYVGAKRSLSTDTARALAVTVAGDVTVSNTANVSPTASSMSGGAAAQPGQPQVVKLTVAGEYQVGDRVSVTLGDDVFGYETRPRGNASSVKTVKSKVYATAASLLAFCALNDPARWSSNETGSGIINMASQDAGSETLVGVEIYYDRVAVFSRQSTQIWNLDADPAQSLQVQVVRNNGAVASGAISQFGDADVFYLADSGLRSLRARDSSNAAAVSDVGTPVDSLIVQHMREVGAAVAARAQAAVEPVTGRFLLALGDTIYVFSYFAGSKIAAWSTYKPGFEVSDFAVLGGRVFARAGDTIYLYGGDTGDEYDTCRVVVELPMLDGQKPATEKTFSGIDAACENAWSVYLGTDPLSPSVRDLVGYLTSTTYSLGRVAVSGTGTHVGLRLECEAPGPARLSNVVVHFDAFEAS